MAIVDGPALSLVASGNLGSICFSRWRGVAIARDVYTGVDPNTGDQQTQRQFLKDVSQAWGGTLTAIERLAWEQAAREQRFVNRLQKKWTPTGYQYFMKMNVQAKTLGYPIQTYPPKKKVGVDQKILHFQNSTSKPLEMSIFFRDSNDQALVSTGFQASFAGPFDSEGRRPTDGEWRIIGVALGLNLVYTGVVITGKYYWGRARYFWSSGETGAWISGQEQAD